jgi:Tol biopolymer transport system component
MTALTSTGNAELAALSPDGKYVAYVQTDDGQQSVWLRQLSSASAVPIVAPSPDLAVWGLTIAPDSSFVDFVRSAAPGSTQRDLWRVPFLGGQARKIIEDVASAPGWSPDGGQMAYFVLVSGDQSRLTVANADGSQPRAIATRKLPRRYLILHITSRPDVRPAWFPDGRAIAVVGTDEQRGASAGQLISIDVASGAETELRAFGAGFLSRRQGMILGRDGRSVTINHAESGPKQVVTLGLQTGEMTRLTNDLAMYGGVSAAGDAVVTTRYQTNSGIWVTDSAGQNARQIGRDVPTQVRGLSWTGNARVVFDATMAGGAGIWSVDVTSGSADLVVPAAVLPSATADGRTLVFHKAGNELWRSDADGRNGVRIAVGSLSQIAPDGSRVFYISGQSGIQTVWVVDLAGGQPRQFTTMSALASSEPAVSPDGRQVVFFSRESAVIMPVDGGEPIRRIPMPYARLRWTPDGRGLTYADAAGTNLRVQPLDGGDSRQLTQFADKKQIANFAWSPDGRQLAVVRAVTTSDIVLLKGVR